MHSRHLKKFILLLALALELGSCAIEKSEGGSHRGLAQRKPAPIVTWDGHGVEMFAPIVSGSGDRSSLAIAISGCDCAPKAVANFINENATSRGTLPQVFVPQIRESIASDSKIQLLSKFPIGLQNALKNWLATDDKISTEIRSGVNKKLQNSLSSIGGTTFGTRTSFRMDLFKSQSSEIASFDIGEQVARWNVVMGRKEMWAGQAPLDGIDHGLQLLESMKVAAEWAYLAGIGSDGKPNGMGGLALDIRSGNKVPAAPFDPATAPTTAGLFASGKFTISYSNASSVDMATKVKEQWAYQANNVSLLEQARIWRAAAFAFQNFRFDKSKNARAIMSHSDGALSAGVRELPLLWLPGLGALLEQRFINKDSRLIKQFAYGDDQPADLESLLALADSIQAWRTALANIETSELSATTIAKLKEVPEKLLLPLQLTLQTILSQHTFVQEGNDAKIYVGSMGLISNNRLSAMTIRVLANLEQNGLQSDELKTRVLSLFASHAPSWTQTQSQSDAATLIEQYRAASSIASYKGAQQWVVQLRDKLANSVAAWSGI